MLKNNKGVTLVELLIVIVILGIIAAIAVPAVGTIVENAEKDALVADATTVRNAASTWCQTATQSQRENYCDSNPTTTQNGVLLKADLEAFIDGLDNTSYAAVRISSSGYEVAIDNGTYSFIGDPLESSRDDVSGTGITVDTAIPTTE